MRTFAGVPRLSGAATTGRVFDAVAVVRSRARLTLATNVTESLHNPHLRRRESQLMEEPGPDSRLRADVRYGTDLGKL
jgi:hypothetical protein